MVNMLRNLSNQYISSNVKFYKDEQSIELISLIKKKFKF